MSKSTIGCETMDIYLNMLDESNSTYEQRNSNARVLYSIVTQRIVPRLDYGIMNHGVPILGTYDMSPYTTMGVGRLFVKAIEDLVKVENFLLVAMVKVKLEGIIDVFEITKVMDGFFIDFQWNLV